MGAERPGRSQARGTCGLGLRVVLPLDREEGQLAPKNFQQGTHTHHETGVLERSLEAAQKVH